MSVSVKQNERVEDVEALGRGDIKGMKVVHRTTCCRGTHPGVGFEDDLDR